MNITKRTETNFSRHLELVAGSATRLMATVNGIRSARDGRAAVSRLLEVDERTLQDIGLSRSDVELALSVAWTADPSIELARIRRLSMQAERQGLTSRRVV